MTWRAPLSSNSMPVSTCVQMTRRSASPDRGSGTGHSRAVPSVLPVKMVLPSGLNVALQT
jgi:hypothetical protein